MDYKKKYNEAQKWIESIYTELSHEQQMEAEAFFPELAESEDERIRKHLIDCVTRTIPEADAFKEISKEKILDWLEKQGEQDNNEDEAILHRFSFYSYKDEPNILYLAGLYVNDEYRNKGIGTKILKIADEVAVSMKCSSILLKTEIGSNAERLYKNNGYSVFRREENQVWLEKRGKNNMGISEATKQELEDNLNKALETETPESCNEFLEKQGEQKQDPCEHCADKRLNCHNFPCVKKRAFEQGKSVFDIINEEKVDNANKVEPKFKEE